MIPVLCAFSCALRFMRLDKHYPVCKTCGKVEETNHAAFVRDNPSATLMPKDVATKGMGCTFSSRIVK